MYEDDEMIDQLQEPQIVLVYWVDGDPDRRLYATYAKALQRAQVLYPRASSQELDARIFDKDVS